MVRLGALVLVAATLAAADPTAAGLAVVNARVWTGNPAQPWADALAIAGERIVAVGSNEEIRALAPPPARIVDARGAMVTPGFIDSHIHLLAFDAARPFPPLYLRFLTTRAEAGARIAGYAAKLPEGSWILGVDWVDATWGGRPPTRQWLDSVAPHHPVWLTNEAGDTGIANTAALRAAGLASRNGIVRGGPMWRIEAAIVERDRERDDRMVEEAQERLARAGVTSVHHNNSWHQLIVFRRLHEAGKLKVRIYACPSFPGWQRLRDFIAEYGRGDSWLHWGGLKGYGTITAERYYPWVSEASRAGLQVMVHVGDEAGLRTLLAVFERVRREQNLRDPRFRVEHTHDMPPDAIPLMAKAGAIASWQPALLAHSDQRTAAGMAPPQNLFPCRALLEAGVRIAFGTDTLPGQTPVSPVESLQMALERAAPDGSRITLDEALRAFTRDAAYSEFAEQEKGTLERRKLADFVLLDSDLSRLPVRRIHEAKVRMTVAGGRVTYEASGLEDAHAPLAEQRRFSGHQ